VLNDAFFVKGMATAAAGALGAIRPGFSPGAIAGLQGPAGLSLQQATVLANHAAYAGALPTS